MSQVKNIFYSSNITSESNPSPLLTVPSHCFSDCSLLTNFYSGNSLSSIDNYAFQKCLSIKSITLGKNVSKLEMYSFIDCVELSQIIIPRESQLAEIQGYVFYNTTLNLFIIEDTNEFTFVDGLLMNGAQTKIIYYIPDKSTQTFVVPSTVEEIGAYAFSTATNFLEVIISPGAIRRISFRAFMDCRNLLRVYTHLTLESIDSEAFLHCNKILCGGVALNPSLVDDARYAGIPSRALSLRCLNNPSALYQKPTINHKSYAFIFTGIFIPLFIFPLF